MGILPIPRSQDDYDGEMKVYVKLMAQYVASGKLTQYLRLPLIRGEINWGNIVLITVSGSLSEEAAVVSLDSQVYYAG